VRKRRARRERIAGARAVVGTRTLDTLRSFRRRLVANTASARSVETSARPVRPFINAAAIIIVRHSPHPVELKTFPAVRRPFSFRVDRSLRSFVRQFASSFYTRHGEPPATALQRVVTLSPDDMPPPIARTVLKTVKNTSPSRRVCPSVSMFAVIIHVGARLGTESPGNQLASSGGFFP